MGIGDSMRNLVGKGKDNISPDQANEGLEQAEDRANDATGGRFESQLDQGRETVEHQFEQQQQQTEQPPDYDEQS